MVQQAEQAWPLFRVEIIINVCSMMPNGVGIVLTWHHIMPNGKPECSRKSLERHGLRGARTADFPKVYQHGEWPHHRDQNPSNCAMNRVVVASVMASDDMTGMNHSLVTK